MNRKSTLLLAAMVLVMGVVALFSARGNKPADPAARAANTLRLDADTITAIRVQRDYWNTFTVSRMPTGEWRLTEPANEVASADSVRLLLETLTRFPVVASIDLPAGDTERYREYGLWEPSLEVRISMADRDRLLQVGSETADGRGVYCAMQGEDGVFITTSETVRALSRDLDFFRPSTATSAAPIAHAGLQIEDLRAGSGAAARPGEHLTVHYSGRLQNGNEFDSSRRRGAPFSFVLGSGEVIAGWDQGLAGMRVGGLRQLTIPPELGYGPRGKQPDIPPNATLVFEIELISTGEGSVPAVATELLGTPGRQSGSTLRVAIRLDQNPDRRIGSYAFDLDYPAGVLEFESASDGGEGFGGMPTANDNRNGTVVLTGVSTDSRITNGRLCILQFRLTGDPPAGGADLVLKGRGASTLADVDFRTVEHRMDSTATRGVFRGL